MISLMFAYRRGRADDLGFSPGSGIVLGGYRHPRRRVHGTGGLPSCSSSSPWAAFFTVGTLVRPGDGEQSTPPSSIRATCGNWTRISRHLHVPDPCCSSSGDQLRDPPRRKKSSGAPPPTPSPICAPPTSVSPCCTSGSTRRRRKSGASSRTSCRRAGADADRGEAAPDRGRQGKGDATAGTVALVDDMIGRVRKISGDCGRRCSRCGLFPALRVYVDAQSALSGVTIELETEGTDRAARSRARIACFRVVQESLTTPSATRAPQRIQVRVGALGPTTTVALIADDGRGFDSDARRGGRSPRCRRHAGAHPRARRPPAHRFAPRRRHDRGRRAADSLSS